LKLVDSSVLVLIVKTRRGLEIQNTKGNKDEIERVEEKG
jgi:hypothetical protein